MKLKKADVKPILAITFPDYKGRKFHLDIRETYDLENYWSGGSREEAKAVAHDGETWQASDLPEATKNPHNPHAHATINIPRHVMLVTHAIYCGQDCGITVVAHPNSPFLPKVLKGAK